MYMCDSDRMMKAIVVKARTHHGSSSLDLTIPSTLRARFGLEAGDLFKVEGRKDQDGAVVVTFAKLKV